MSTYIIGIDTGGTCTDAVLIERSSGKIIDSAKVPTTHHRLDIGTGNALKTLLTGTQISPSEVAAVGVSSTLATNSVVENKGAQVGLFVIGYVKHFKLPVKAVIYIKGGHTIKGEEEEPLDLQYLVNELSSLKGEVDAYAVCSAMSMKNPTHELVAEKAISMMDPRPVFCSHRISQQAGMQERAATAGLHAKLMPIMQEYMKGVGEALAELQLTCPMIVIGGNGQPISSEDAVEQAGLTVASGPACTAYFGSQNTKRDSLVIDIGGTTTDIAMVEAGRPHLSREGCIIGDWKTQVEAVDMFTRGIGGDSHVQVKDNGSISLGPNRVVPIAMSELDLPVEEWLGATSMSKCIGLHSKGQEEQSIDPVLQFLREHGPATPKMIRNETGLGGIPLDKQLEKMSRQQLIFETGFTPTDALHVLGKMAIGDPDKAYCGAALLGKKVQMEPTEFCEMILQLAEEKIFNVIIEYVFHRYWGNAFTGFSALSSQHPVLGVDFSLKIPLIGIGAAASHFLPNITKRLSTTVTFPHNFEVGNAIGAALICQNRGTKLMEIEKQKGK